MKDFGNTIYMLGCVVTATVLGIGFADYWFGNHQLTAFLSWAVLAAIPWLVGRALLFVLPSLEAGRRIGSMRTAVKREAEEDWGQ